MDHVKKIRNIINHIEPAKIDSIRYRVICRNSQFEHEVLGNRTMALDFFRKLASYIPFIGRYFASYSGKESKDVLANEIRSSIKELHNFYQVKLEEIRQAKLSTIEETRAFFELVEVVDLVAKQSVLNDLKLKQILKTSIGSHVEDMQALREQIHSLETEIAEKLKQIKEVKANKLEELYKSYGDLKQDLSLAGAMKWVEVGAQLMIADSDFRGFSAGFLKEIESRLDREFPGVSPAERYHQVRLLYKKMEQELGADNPITQQLAKCSAGLHDKLFASYREKINAALADNAFETLKSVLDEIDKSCCGAALRRDGALAKELRKFLEEMKPLILEKQKALSKELESARMQENESQKALTAAQKADAESKPNFAQAVEDSKNKLKVSFSEHDSLLAEIDRLFKDLAHKPESIYALMQRVGRGIQFNEFDPKAVTAGEFRDHLDKSSKENAQINHYFYAQLIQELFTLRDVYRRSQGESVGFNPHDHMDGHKVVVAGAQAAYDEARSSRERIELAVEAMARVVTHRNLAVEEVQIHDD